jgi:hypothetical protein
MSKDLGLKRTIDDQSIKQKQKKKFGYPNFSGSLIIKIWAHVILGGHGLKKIV